MRPIFSPSARTSEVSPSAMGDAARAGVALAPAMLVACPRRVRRVELRDDTGARVAGSLAVLLALAAGVAVPLAKSFEAFVPVARSPATSPSATTAEMGLDV